MKTTTELLSQLNTMQTNHIKVLNERIEVLTQTIEIDRQNTFNTLVSQLKGERDVNPKMNITDAQINDLAQDVKDSLTFYSKYSLNV